MRTTGYTTDQRVLEAAAIAAFAVLAAVGFYRVAAHAPVPGWMIPAAALAGWAAADLFSGLVHWAFDAFGSVRTPVLGPRFVRPFREHHVDAGRIAEHDFVETNGASCIAALPALVLAALLPPERVFLQAVMLFTVLGVLGANQCHKWAHMAPERVPRLVRLAQRCRLILRPEEHRLHHRHPFDTHYCTASGWLNPVLDAVLRPWR